MDIVITYVDGKDPLWQKDYEEYVGRKILAKRFRDWGFLPFLFRGVEKYMPFVDNVYLVVARESQVPQWINRDQVKIVLHKDIIPTEFLPLFNAGAIEMFLHNIEGLSEHYLYFNDDIYPVRPCKESDFFIEGKPATGFAKCFFKLNMFKKQTALCDRLARKTLGQKPGLFFVRPQHICTPMRKSICTQVYDLLKNEIKPSISRLRTATTPNQYLFLDYMYYSGQAISRRLSSRHFSLAASSADKISSFLANPDRNLTCINDVEMPEQKFIEMQAKIADAFSKRFPEKSRFEK